MSGGEILLIFLAILVLFGADKMPGIARSIGRGMREFQKAADEIKSELVNSTSDLRDEVNNIRSDIQDNISQTSDTLKDTKDEIRATMNNTTNQVHTGNTEPSGKEKDADDNKSKPNQDFADIGANI